MPKPYTPAQFVRGMAYLVSQENKLLPEAPWWAQEAIREHLTPQVLNSFLDALLTATLTGATS